MAQDKTPVCPECGKPVEVRFAPFCSQRCQQIDLGRWLKGEFVIPGPPLEPGVEQGAPVPQPPANDEE